MRMAQIIKGRWRDTSWYSQLAEEWPENKAKIERWLDDANFDEHGKQRSSLRQLRRGNIDFRAIPFRMREKCVS